MAVITTPQGKDLKAKARFTVEEANTWIKLQVKAIGKHDPEECLTNMIQGKREWWTYEDGETFEDRWPRYVSVLWLQQDLHKTALLIKKAGGDPKEIADLELDPEALHLAGELRLLTFEEWKTAALIVDPQNVIEEVT